MTFKPIAKLVKWVHKSMNDVICAKHNVLPSSVALSFFSSGFPVYFWGSVCRFPNKGWTVSAA